MQKKYLVRLTEEERQRCEEQPGDSEGVRRRRNGTRHPCHSGWTIVAAQPARVAG